LAEVVNCFEKGKIGKHKELVEIMEFLVVITIKKGKINAVLAMVIVIFI
jgi:hypothetical protein